MTRHVRESACSAGRAVWSCHWLTWPGSSDAGAVLDERWTAPRWLVEVMRPRRTPPPWARMVRAPLAIAVPVALGMATGHIEVGLPAAMGGLCSTMAERGGPYFGRVKRVGTVAVFGGTLGLASGLFLHGRGWLTVLGIVLLALVSAVLSVAGNVGSVTGLQLLLFAVLGTGPLGLITPWWMVVGPFVVGAAWGLCLSLVGWVFFRRVPEERSVSAVYRAIAPMARAVGTDAFGTTRQQLTTALNTAYDDLLTTRAALAGSDSRQARLVLLLNQSYLLAAAVVTLDHEGNRPDPEVDRFVLAVANTVEAGGQSLPPLPRTPTDTPGGQALSEALETVAAVVAGATVAPQETTLLSTGARHWLRAFGAELRNGSLARLYALRLMVCMGVAAAISEVLPLQRSYWVMLTVAVVLKPDFGSVFARAVQRGVGTIVGAVLGAVLLAVLPYGPLLLIPLAVFTFLMPYGMSRNYALLAASLTPVVVFLIDLLTRGGWQLAEDRLIDTAIGCAVVLLLGYLPWPSSWYARIGPQFADAVRETAHFLDHAFAGPDSDRSLVRRHAYRQLSDLRTVFQQALAEPASLNRQASAWYPAAVALERTIDTITATFVATQRGAAAPSGPAVSQLVAALDEIGRAVRTGEAPPHRALPSDPAARPIARAIEQVQELFWPSGNQAAPKG